MNIIKFFVYIFGGIHRKGYIYTYQCSDDCKNIEIEVYGRVSLLPREALVYTGKMINKYREGNMLHMYI